MTLVYVLLVAHFVADFLCQTDWMAVNKSKDWNALTWHVAVYGLVLGVVLRLATGPRGLEGGWFVLANMGAHFVQDAITSRITSRLWFVRGAYVTPKAVVDSLAYINAVGEFISPKEAGDAMQDALRDGAVVRYSDTRHWFFVAIGADQLLHYVTLFVTAGWWLQ